MQPVRKYPWNDFTINDWLAVDADNHVCFVESYREKFAPHWISIPSHYLANLHVRLEHACSYTAPLQTKQILTDQEIADILGIFFLSSPNDGGNDVPYVYEAVPAVPRTVHELPEPFSAIAENVRLPRKRLVAKEEIRCHDWIQGNITELDTLSMDNGLLVEKQDSADLVWLPSDFRRTRCEVMHVRFLPNAKLQKEMTTTFPTYVDWGRYKALFQDLIQCYCHLLAAESDTVQMDSDGLPNRTSLFYTHGIPVGCYTFGPPGDDSFLLDHGEIDLWLVAKKLPRAELMESLIEICKNHNAFLYTLPEVGFIQSLKEHLHVLNVFTAPENPPKSQYINRLQTIKVCYPAIPVNHSPHFSHLFQKANLSSRPANTASQAGRFRLSWTAYHTS